jgi:broad specificity phosphatase PhoE
VVDPERWQVVDFDGRPLATTGEAQAHQVARALRRAVAVPAVDRVDIEL